MSESNQTLTNDKNPTIMDKAIDKAKDKIKEEIVEKLPSVAQDPVNILERYRAYDNIEKTVKEIS